MLAHCIFITGASGSGTTTLGAALAEAVGCPQHDTDDSFWLPTNPPYRERRPMPERLEMLEQALGRTDGWVISGGMEGWGDPLMPRFDLAVFLWVPADLRVSRLRIRERREIGAEMVDPGGPLHEEHEAFLAWAAAYDSGTQEGRDLAKQTVWLARLTCPVLRLEGNMTTEERVAKVLDALSSQAEA